MEQLIRSFFSIAFITLVACGPSPRMDPGLERIRDEFIAANKAKSIEPMLRLYYLEGSDERNVNLLRTALNYELGLEISAIEFSPLTGAPEETIAYTYEGVEYGPTLAPQLRMRVVYKSEDAFTSLFTIGQTRDGAWKIVSSKPIRTLNPNPGSLF